MPTFTHTVLTTPTRALVASKQRKSYSIVNSSAVDVYVGKDRNVTAGVGFRQGIKLPASGGSLEDEFYKEEVWLVAASSTSVTVVDDVE